jgi:hypothetical protein
MYTINELLSSLPTRYNRAFFFFGMVLIISYLYTKFVCTILENELNSLSFCWVLSEIKLNHLKKQLKRSIYSWLQYENLLFGKGSSVILDSKEVHPKRLLKAGFEFTYPRFETALYEIME